MLRSAPAPRAAAATPSEGADRMADLRTTFAGIASPNPFWLASAPPTDKAYNVHRAFEAGWGGVVWKTLGEDGPPIVNVNGPRYGALLTPTGACSASTTSSSSPTGRCRSTSTRSPRSSAAGPTGRWSSR